MKKIILGILLLLSVNVNAEQTLTQISAGQNEIFYQVPVEITSVGTGIPTDFYLSIGSGTIWSPISATIGWGVSPNTQTWTPLEVLTNVNIGVHTGLRNSGTFGTIPSDVSDFSFDIQRGSATLTGNDKIWSNDLFYFEWDYLEGNLPTSIIFEYFTGSSNSWTLIDTLSTNSKAISFLNNEIKEDVTFRLTYTGNEYGYTIAETSSTFLKPDLFVINKDTIESRIYNNDQEVILNFSTERISEYSGIMVEVNVNGTILDYDILNYNSSTFGYYTSSFGTNSSTISFYVEGFLLETVEVNSTSKIFELRPTNLTYTIGDKIEFDWTHTSEFDYTEISVQRNSSTVTEVLNVNWGLLKSWMYEVRDTDSLLVFTFKTTDGVTTIIETSEVITITDHCQADSLSAVITNLEELIDSLEIVIWELESRPTDTLFVVLIKDDFSGVEEEYVVDLKTTGQFFPVSGIITLPTMGQHVYLIDMTGKMVQYTTFTSIIDINNLPSGIYILSYVTAEEVQFGKFIKD